MNIKYAHTNIIARDWKVLADFYVDVFGCKIKPPERNLKGGWLDNVTALKDAHIKGVHLILPGYDENGPTLEIFQYSQNEIGTRKRPNSEGFAHIAFVVDDVAGCVENIIRKGGGLVGEIVHTQITGAGAICFAYACDPEGNIIEIQKWC